MQTENATDGALCNNAEHNSHIVQSCIFVLASYFKKSHCYVKVPMLKLTLTKLSNPTIGKNTYAPYNAVRKKMW